MFFLFIKNIMKKTSPLLKIAFFTYLVDPLFYVSSLITVLFVSFRFFFMQKFFVDGAGSTDLRIFFNSVPLICILTVPLLVLRIRRLILSDSVPLSSFRRLLSLVISVFSAFCIPLILLSVLPFCVSLFGNVDAGQCISGYFGIFLYGISAAALSILFFEIFPAGTALPLLFSSMILAVVNFIHLLPLYLKTGKIVSFFARGFSFAWHFDSFGKGILDSRNIFYYLCVSLILILLSVFFEYKRIGKTVSKITLLLFAGIFVFLSLSVKNCYFRIDLTESRQFSISGTSRNLLDGLEGDLRITYFRSSEMKELYPQTTDVAEFLSDFSSESGRVTFNIEKAEPEKLGKIGIQGQQIQRNSGTKMEFVTVYSAVLLQYLEKSEIIPFVLSTNTLEYDLVQRVQSLVTGNQRKVYLLCGNGRSVEESYAYVFPWLNSRGFKAEVLNDFNSSEVLKNLSPDDEICIFGSKDLSPEQVFLIEAALEKGTKAFIAASPFHTTIEDEWKISKKRDGLISYLNGKGFAFENSLVMDTSCFPLTMASGSGEAAEYVTENYPLWVALLNQKEAAKGAAVFWSSPLSLYGGVTPLLYTSGFSWAEEPSGTENDLFMTNPFLIPKTSGAAGKENCQFVVAARKDNISLVSDQFFVSSLMTGFISGENGGDFRNYDYLTKELLVLREESEIADLMEKNLPVTSLYKIVDEDSFKTARLVTILVCFGLLPLLFIVLFAFSRGARNRL